MKRTIYAIIILLAVHLSATAERTVKYLSLEECREYALDGNKQSQISKENVAMAEDMRKAAMASFFPKVSANGGYAWVEKNMYLLPDTYEFSFGTMNADGTFTFNENALQRGLFDYADLKQAFPELDQRISEWVAKEYTNAREATEMDIHNVFVGQVGVTQPLFLGGKILETYKIAKAYETIENLKADKNTIDVLVQVDEAYWRVISVEQKYKLASRYCEMLRKVEQDMTVAAEEGTVTQSELLKVRVKLNEAEVSQMKAENGLRLSKMALCQLIGIDLDTDLVLDDSRLNEPVLTDAEGPNMEEVWMQRKELQMLEAADKIAKSGVKLTASTLMPNVIASANYIVTNPNMHNGWQNNFSGFFTAGVAVNVPIAHADDIYRLKAAKHKARTVELQLEEAKEKIELQTTQSVQQLNEANRKLVMATANIANAEENLRLAQAAFDEGMLTSTELLGAQTAWLKAYSEKIDAAIDVRMYEVYLKKNSGQM